MGSRGKLLHVPGHVQELPAHPAGDESTCSCRSTYRVRGIGSATLRWRGRRCRLSRRCMPDGGSTCGLPAIFGGWVLLRSATGSSDYRSYDAAAGGGRPQGAGRRPEGSQLTQNMVFVLTGSVSGIAVQATQCSTIPVSSTLSMSNCAEPRSVGSVGSSTRWE